MDILLDEDSESHRLVTLLQGSGHTVLTVTDLKLVGEEDEVILAHAKAEDRVLLTKNAKDFVALHKASTDHPGIMVHYPERGAALPSVVVVTAINLVEVSGIPVAGNLIVLNQFRP
jgi:hypothetical protein